MAEPIEMPFVEMTRVGPRNHVLDGVDIPHRNGQFWGLSCPLKSIGSLCCGVCGKRDHSVVNNGMTADCNAPYGSVSHCIVPHEKFAPVMRPFVIIL